ncbi:alpha-amylase [Legionella sp. 27fs60]|uniref:Alpha-amylase n=2 Tax=Legionella bononiensis TaxID=2793102 RepID=A0ABS1W8W8_9GAMM|nr:alpha-amylase [Legionella bononiensis]MBL7525808.1 alpha-amylase [Legionella bononiensis]MBL7561990.1 alpha-amylase [Legionella bononiensis]
MANDKLDLSQREVKAENPVLNGNGILRCYNMFPTQFGTISSMTEYMSKLHKMGFNAVWLNPIQATGDVKDLRKRDKTNGVRAFNLVSRSLYAMTDTDLISPFVSDASSELPLKDKQEIDKKSLQQLTDAARKNGLVPMFDLVLNHVASDSRHRLEHPEWFQKEVHKDFKDAIAFDYSDPKIRDEIIEKFWRPYIEKYMVEYGFEGVRVDAVAYVHPMVRQKIYEIIYETAKNNNKPRPIILDELLFDDPDKTLEQVVKEVQLDSDLGPTHITRGTYYAQRDRYGGLPAWCKDEEGLKAQVIFQKKNGELRVGAKGGCISFSGNHDHDSLAMKILEEMAHKRLSESPELHHAYELDFVHKSKKERDEAIQSIYLYSFIKDIQNEVLSGNTNTIKEVEYKMREKMAMSALTSSGGWYALSGDESGDLLAKPVFRRAHAQDQTYYAQRIHNIFDSEHKDHKVAMEVLTKMAIENLQQEPLGTRYNELHLHPHAQQRLLVSYIENLKNQINCGDSVVCSLFQEKLQQKDISIDFEEASYTPTPRTPDNGWNGKHDMSQFMGRMNHVLDTLPSSHSGFWSEIIKIPDKPDLFIVVRKNGMGLSSKTDLAIVNLNPDVPVDLTHDDIHQIACNFQKRVIPENNEYGHPNWHQGNPDFNMAYHTVMACIDAHRIHVDDTIIPKIPVSKLTFDYQVSNRNRMFATTQPPSKVDMEKVMEGTEEDILDFTTPSNEGEDKKMQEGLTPEVKVQI